MYQELSTIYYFLFLKVYNFQTKYQFTNALVYNSNEFERLKFNAYIYPRF